MSTRIDAHVHIYDKGFWPPKWFDHVATRWAANGSNRAAADIRSRIEDGMADPDGANLLRQMDELKIDRAVILTVDWELGIGDRPEVPILEMHQRYAKISEETKGRILPFAGLDPRRPDCVTLLEREIDSHGVVGLKLYPPTGFYPFDEQVFPLYDLCESRGLPVAIHTGGTIGLLRPRFANPLYIQDVQRSFPNLTIWIAHAGSEWWWDEAVAVASNGIDTYLELSGWQDVAHRDEARLVRMLDQARNAIGVERLLFGSDHISGRSYRGIESYRSWVQWFEELDVRARRHGVQFSSAEVEAILGENARRCLGI